MWAVGILIALPISAFFVYATLFVSDLPAIPNHDDLIPPKVEIADEDNAYFYFKEINGTAQQPATRFKIIESNADKTFSTKDYLAKEIDEITTEEHAMAKEIIEQNREVLDFAATGLSMQYQDPAFVNPAEIVFDLDGDRAVYTYFQVLSRVVTTEARYEYSQGNDLVALRIIINWLNFLDYSKDSNPSLTETLVFQVVKKNLTAEMIYLIQNSNSLDVTQLISLANGLGKYKKGGEEQLINSMKMEFVHTFATAKFFKNELNENIEYSYQHNRSMGYMFNHFRCIIDIIHEERNDDSCQKTFETLSKINIPMAWESAATYPKYMKTPDKLPLEFYIKNQAIFNWASPNSVGNILYTGYASFFSRAIEKTKRQESLFSMAVTIAALKAYYLDIGSHAPSLDVLVPDYIFELPLDPFDGEIIKYSSSNKTVYSVGVDGVDDGGNLPEQGENWSKGADLAFSANFK